MAIESILEVIIYEKARLVLFFFKDLMILIDFRCWGGNSASHTERCIIHPRGGDQLSTTRMVVPFEFPAADLIAAVVLAD